MSYKPSRSGMHSFRIDIATDYSIEGALLLQHIYFWLQRFRLARENFHGDAFWVRLNLKDVVEIFPYMPLRGIRYRLQELEKAGVIKSEVHNVNHFDRTLSYTLTAKGWALFGDNDVDESEYVPEDDEPSDPAPTGYDGGEFQTGGGTDGREFQTKNRGRKGYGSYKNVLLTEEDIGKLRQEFPDDYEDRIERVSLYCASKGKAYRNYLATIRNWARMDKQKTETPQTAAQEAEHKAFRDLSAKVRASSQYGKPLHELLAAQYKL